MYSGTPLDLNLFLVEADNPARTWWGIKTFMQNASLSSGFVPNYVLNPSFLPSLWYFLKFYVGRVQFTCSVTLGFMYIYNKMRRKE